MPAMSTRSILIWKDIFVRYSMGPPTGFPATNMKPVTAFMAKPATPQGISFSRRAIGKPLPTPRIRRSTRPTVPINNDMPTKWSISHAGHTQSLCLTNTTKLVLVRKVENTSIESDSLQPQQRGDEVRIGGQAPRNDRQRPAHDRQRREELG